MKLHPRTLVAATALFALTLAGCSQGKNTEESSATPSATASASAEETPNVNRNYDGALPEVTGEFAVSATIGAGSGEAPKEIIAKTLQPGSGEEVKADDVVLIHYAGALWDGKEFDSSFKRSNPDAPDPVLFSLNSLIKGWKYGLAGQHVGDRVQLVIPPEWGYGSQDQGSIPANSSLVFVVDIVDRADPQDLSALKDATDQNASLPAGVKVEGELGAEPQLTVGEDVQMPDKLTTIAISEGKGEVLQKEDYVLVHMVSSPVPPTQPAESSWKQGIAVPSQTPIGDTFNLAGHHIGSRLLVMVPEQGDTPAVISVIDLVAKASTKTAK